MMSLHMHSAQWHSLCEYAESTWKCLVNDPSSLAVYRQSFCRSQTFPFRKKWHSLRTRHICIYVWTAVIISKEFFNVTEISTWGACGGLKKSAMKWSCDGQGARQSFVATNLMWALIESVYQMLVSCLQNVLPHMLIGDVLLTI